MKVVLFVTETSQTWSRATMNVIDNFRVTTGYGFKNFKNLKSSLDKGHRKQFELLINQVKNGGSSLIPIDEIINTTSASFAAIESLKKRSWIKIS